MTNSLLLMFIFFFCSFFVSLRKTFARFFPSCVLCWAKEGDNLFFFSSFVSSKENMTSIQYGRRGEHYRRFYTFFWLKLCLQCLHKCPQLNKLGCHFFHFYSFSLQCSMEGETTTSQISTLLAYRTCYQFNCLFTYHQPSFTEMMGMRGGQYKHINKHLQQCGKFNSYFLLQRLPYTSYVQLLL